MELLCRNCGRTSFVELLIHHLTDAMPPFQNLNQARNRLIICRVHQLTGRQGWEALNELIQQSWVIYGSEWFMERLMIESVTKKMTAAFLKELCHVRIYHSISVTNSTDGERLFTSISGASSLLYPSWQLISEGLIPVSATCCKGTDWTVDRPRHFHLLGHLCKAHY